MLNNQSLRYVESESVGTPETLNPLSSRSGGATFVEFHEAIFEFSVVFYLMYINTHHAADLDSDRRSRTDGDWVVCHGNS